MKDLHNLTATEAVVALRSGDLSAKELIDASIKRSEEVDGSVNALPIKCYDRALDQAVALDLRREAENPRSLCGLPIAVKDYNDVGGIVTTYGSPIYSEAAAEKSDATVQSGVWDHSEPLEYSLECWGIFWRIRRGFGDWPGLACDWQ